MVAPVASVGAPAARGRPRSDSEMSGLSGGGGGGGGGGVFAAARDDDDFDAALSSLLELKPSSLRARSTTTKAGGKKGKRGDPQATKLAALTSALIETAKERRRDGGGADGDDVAGAGDGSGRAVGPAELFVAALSALSGSLLSPSADKADLFYPLLEVLRAIAPHAARSSPALYLSQFGTLARSLGGVGAFAVEMGREEGGGGEGGAAAAGAGAGAGAAAGSNALLRRTCRTSSAALTSLLSAAENVKGGAGAVDAKVERDASALLRSRVLVPFDDSRAKVRREAHGAALGVVLRSLPFLSPSSGSGSDGGGGGGARRLAGTMQSLVAKHAHRVLTSEPSKKKKGGGGGGGGADDDEADRYARSMHLLPFLERAGPELAPKPRVGLGEDLVGLALGLIEAAAASSAAAPSGAGKGAKGDADGRGRALRMCSSALAALAPLIESSAAEEGEGEGEGDGGGNDSSPRPHPPSEEVGRFASRVLASLLQHASQVSAIAPRPAAGGAETVAEIRVLFSRCCAACAVRLSSAPGELSDVAAKLLPLTASALLGLCDSSRLFDLVGKGGDGASGGAEHVTASGIAAELARIARTCLPRILALEQDPDKREGVMKCVRGTLGAMAAAAFLRHRRHWDAVLPALAATIVTVHENLPDPSSEAMEAFGAGDAVRALVDARSHVEESAPASREVVSAAAGTVVDGMGVEAFLSLAGLDSDPADAEAERCADGVREDRAWMLRILPRSPSCAGRGGIETTRLSYFRETVLALARRCDAAAARAAKKGAKGAAEAAVKRERVVELWGVLPYFCGHPRDLGQALPQLAPIFVKAMGDSRYPQLLTIVCHSLRTLAAGVRERADAGDPVQDEGRDAAADLAAMSEASTRLLPTLFRIVETLHGAGAAGASPSAGEKKKRKGGDGDGDDGMDVEEEEGNGDGARTKRERKAAADEEAARRVPAVAEAIGELARVCPRPFLAGLFRKVVQRLLAATAEADERDDDDEDGKAAAEDRICSLLGLAGALVSSGSLDEDSVSLLSRSVRPLMRSDARGTRVQKRAYKVTAGICERHPSFVSAPGMLEEMAELLVGSVSTCHVSSRGMRLRCMTHVARGLDKSDPRQMAVIPDVAGEVLLCLKDSNAKTREAAYQLLLAMAEARGDLPDFFKIVAAALGARTAHMRSAAVMALSRLTFEYARTDESLQDLLPPALSAVVALFDDASREVTKAAVGFVRVCVAALEPRRLEPLLPDVVGGLLKYGRGRGRFRAKIKIVLKKLARTFGYERVASLVPEGDVRLVTHMRKLAERAERRRATGRPDGGGGDGRTAFDDMMGSDEDDSDDGRTLLTGATGFTRMTAASGGKSLRSAAVERARSVAAARSAAGTAKSARTCATSASAPRIRAERAGEVLDMLDPSVAKSVHFADEMEEDEFSDDDGEEMEFDDMGRLVVGDDADDDNAGEVRDGIDEGENGEIEGGGKRRRISKFESAKTAAAEARAKKAKRKKDEPRSLGAAYKSKKAGGDVKKKGQKFEPYAYVPLDGKSYSKRNRGKAVAQMATVVKTKAGGKRKRR